MLWRHRLCRNQRGCLFPLAWHSHVRWRQAVAGLGRCGVAVFESLNVCMNTWSRRRQRFSSDQHDTWSNVASRSMSNLDVAFEADPCHGWPIRPVRLGEWVMARSGPPSLATIFENMHRLIRELMKSTASSTSIVWLIITNADAIHVAHHSEPILHMAWPRWRGCVQIPKMTKTHSRQIASACKRSRSRATGKGVHRRRLESSFCFTATRLLYFLFLHRTCTT